MTFQEDERRFKELILYISQKCAHDKKFGSTKLNKILFYSDFLAYGNLGEPITGFEYQRLEQGPAPRKLLPIRKAMIKRGELGLQEVRLQGAKAQIRTVNLRSPDLKVFTASQIAIVDSVIEALRDADADAVSELSHRMAGWKAAHFKETIPYETVFISADPPTEADTQRGLEIAREFDLITE
jgi:hypothetical protein